MMKTYHITLEGIIQGLGFRLLVYRLAKEFEATGWVTNNMQGVAIKINLTHHQVDIFIQKLCYEKPELAQITAWNIEEVPSENWVDFRIISSQKQGKRKLWLTADLDTCSSCLTEFYDSKSRFFQYPLISCTDCGARYSMFEKLPYDRKNTTMDDFPMCGDCQDDYENPANRRFHAQGHSCQKCGVTTLLYNSDKQFIKKNIDALEEVVKLIEKGKIIAIKGIGGFLLVADAQNSDIISVLRKRKHCPTKPFALMYPNLAEIEKDVYVSEQEKVQLESRQKPIVLLRVRENSVHDLALENIVPQMLLRKLGVMLPYTALFDFLLKKLNRPIVATSGNITQSPIVFENEKALDELTEIADFILTHDRKITVSQDDSIISFAPESHQKIILRRWRGYAPNYIQQDLASSEKSVSSLGAMLKSTFTLTHQGNTYTSQYLGNLGQYATQLLFQKNIAHFTRLFEAKPDVILTDKHPHYFSTEWGKNLVKSWNIPHLKIQHHQAHFWAVLAENQLLESNRILGVIWDGTGLGDDGNIWGGEFFMYENQQINRLEHLDYFPSILGDKMASEPRISLLSLLGKSPLAESILQEKFSPIALKNYQKLAEKSTLKTSSMGRFFDAVGALLGLGDVQSFEGEVAMRLESMAQQFYLRSTDYQEFYPISTNPKTILEEILIDIQHQKNTAEMAFKFHLTLVQMIQQVVQKY